MGRRLDTVCVPPQPDLVEIQLQDLRLGQRILDLVGEDRLLDLAGRRVGVADQQVLGDLLGDGRAAARAPTAAELLGIVDDRARQPRIVDAAMLEEALVLGRQERTDEQRRIFVERQFDAAFAGVGLDRRAVDTTNMGRQRRLIGLECIDRGRSRMNRNQNTPPPIAASSARTANSRTHQRRQSGRRGGSAGSEGEKVSTAMALRGFV